MHLHSHHVPTIAARHHPTRQRLAWGLILCLATLRPAVPAESARSTGSIVGRVSDASSRSFLQGALVEVPSVAMQTFTDATGGYVLQGLAPGEHTIVTSYTGLAPARAVVTVAAGQRSVRDFELAADIQQMEGFIVVGEREGNAASIVRQQTAPNVKNVVALDAFGTLPNEALGEVLIRLPGVIGEFGEHDSITGVSIRGTPSALNTVSVDGNLQASVGGFARDYRLDYVSGALFDELEVTKAPTPEMSADGLGGAVNLRTRSSLTMKEKRRITYRAAARWAPPFYDHTPRRHDHPLHPLLTFGYQELFDVLGERRNLGVTFNAFYSENVSTFSQMVKDYQYTTASPAYVWDYRTADNYIDRLQTSMNLKLDYRLSGSTRLFFNTLYNTSPSPFQERRTFRAYTGRTIAAIGADGQPTGTGAILPGYTDQVTRVRPVAASTVELNSTGYGFHAREHNFNLGARHEYDRWRIDYNAADTASKSWLGNSHHKDNRGGIFTMTTTGIGWLLDNTESAVEPAFQQTGGPSIFDGGSYRNGLLTARDSQRNTYVSSASANAAFIPPTSFASVLKVGGRFRRQKVEEIVDRDRRWNYVGSAPLSVLADLGLRTSDGQRNGRELPFPNPTYVSQHIAENPGMWTEDRYYAEQRRFSGTRDVEESVGAGFVQAQATLRGLGVLAGARVERTEVTSNGYVAARVLTSTAQRTADPVGAARADYNNPRELKGRYTDVFPGVHLTYRLRKNFQARASWSNSIGRPAMSNLLPLETVNTTAETVTINNPALKPQYAEKWDGSLEYYFEPVGVVSIGVFRKEIEDFIVSTRGRSGVVGSGPDNGFNGNYAGYEILTQFNGGSVLIDGWEINYRQQLSFLPGYFRGLGVFANYTSLAASGDYGDGVQRDTREVANFVPESFNAGVTYTYRGFGARVLGNYMGDTLRTYATDPSQRVYQTSRVLVNAGLSYRWGPRLQVSCDLTNVFNRPQERYKYIPSRPSTYTVNGTTVTFSVSGTY